MPVLSRNPIYRFLEMVPALLVWGTFLFIFLLSWLQPLVAMYFVILFDLYWLLRVLYFIVFVLIAWRQYRSSIGTLWFNKLQIEHRRELGEILHIIFLPTYHEPASVLEATLNSLLRVHYPKDRLWLVLAGEARDQEHFAAVSATIQERFGDAFGRLIITEHPFDLPDEIPGKGSNLNYAGHELKKIIDSEKIPYDQIIVSSFDADTQPHVEYFAALTYRFLHHPNRLRASYQPVALYNNNIWEASPILRVAAFGTTFWLMTDLARPERLITFSSHSMPWQMLVDVDFWQKDIVSEDSRIFLQAFLHYDGDYEVTPLFIPVSMDTVSGSTPLRTLVNLYKQQRRWAWGVEHFPFMLWCFRQHPDMPWQKKVKYFFTSMEGMYSWATAPLVIFLAGRLPLYFVSTLEQSSLLVFKTPIILQWLLSLAMGGILISSYLSILLLPPRPESKHRWNILVMIAQWLLLPITLVLFGAIPAIDAQTRLMLGRYLEFNVTHKRRRRRPD